MKPITPDNIKAFSSIFHGILAGFVVLVLLVNFFYEFSSELLLLWCISIAFASCFGWVFGSWYVPIKGERWYFECYFVTPIISLLSAVMSGLLFALLAVAKASSLNGLNIGIVFDGGIFIGFYAFVLTLPITIVAGVAIALYLRKSLKVG